VPFGVTAIESNKALDNEVKRAKMHSAFRYTNAVSRLGEFTFDPMRNWFRRPFAPGQCLLGTLMSLNFRAYITRFGLAFKPNVISCLALQEGRRKISCVY
jgi:hypothetical protein